MRKAVKNRYDHVGRPTNEEVKKRKRKAFIIFGIFSLFILIIIALLIYLISGISKNNLTANTSAATLKRVFKVSTANSSSSALQGSTGYGNRIYFSTSKSGTGNQKNYYSKIKFYDINTKKIYSITTFDEVLSKMPNYKINDITTNTVGRNYYLLVDETSRNNSKIIFSTNNIVRKLTLDKVLTNIAYNENDKKYYSLIYNNIYSFDIPSVAKSNVNKDLGIVNSSLVCNIEKRKGISSQGITIKDNFLLHSFQKISKDNVYVNYIDVYNIEDCKKNNKIIEPFQTLNLGNCKLKSGLNNCVVGSLFYINRNLYVGYNNSSFNGISFYKFDLSIKDNSETTSKETTTKNTTTSKVVTTKNTTTTSEITTTKNTTTSIKAITNEQEDSKYKATGYLGNPINPKNTKKSFMSSKGAGASKCFPYYCRTKKAHSGFDLNWRHGVIRGTKVYAMDSGIVTFAGTYSKNCYGKCKTGQKEGLGVVIDHGNGYKTAYYHFSKRVVKKGEKVKKGDLIGYVGNTGNSKGTHLHISLINESLYYDKCNSKFSCAAGHNDRGFMNAAKYINKNVSYVGKKN